MSKGEELDDYAETAVLPRETTAAKRPVEPARAPSMTVQDLEQLLMSSPQADLPPADYEPDDHGLDHSGADPASARYAEYLLLLDRVPVLRDVVQEPPHVPTRDFRRGERPDVRRQPREDAYVLRERHARDVDEQYAEYSSLLNEPPKRRGARQAPKKRAKPSKRTKRRKA